ncbi:MAG: conjugal transfer protein TraX [Lachnospiraceae bacterium]|nr:conjugal transfer protein TraX [Lachnospiraceae bacterium]
MEQRLKEQHAEGASAGTLKVVAVITMFIDHFGLAILGRLLLTGACGAHRQEIYIIYRIMRDIGRNAFPIYAFLLAEGITYTHSKWRYLLRIGLLAFISEVPFDLAFKARILEFTYQNVFFTLFLGLLMLIGMQLTLRKSFFAGHLWADRIVKGCLLLVICAAAAGAATVLCCDYRWRGVLLIGVLYLLRPWKQLQLMAGYLVCLVVLGEFWAFPAFLLLFFYRGKKGVSSKVFFYGFYPVHLGMLYLISVWMGLAYCSVL